MTDGTAVAVVGMAAVFPGAPDLSTFWRNIVDGVDAISEVPASRWDASYYDPDAAGVPASDRFYCRRGGFVEAVSFDPARFGIMPVAAEVAEPDQLLALSVASDAIADAGGEARLPDRAKVGVIVGRGGYLTPGIARLDQRVRTAHQLVATLRELLPDVDPAQLDRVRRSFQDRLGPERAESSIGLVPNLVASRIANRLDLHGPAYTVDAACASSLVAVDHAVQELSSGRCDAVIAGGVHHCHDVTLWSVFTQLGALSPSQQIRPFHRGADGILIGEGTGMVVLRRLADAERDGDRVYAVIRGTGVASDGRASSLMKPRADGQVLALERAWRAAGLDPAEPGAIGLLEAHGTATPAGDETEIASLTRVFGSALGEIGLGSVKSMIGHAMPAAGMAGLIKAALAVHHGVLPPTLHCDDPHPALTGTRFRPVIRAEPWRVAGRAPRRAGVNAFGFGGINAHVVLEEAAARAGLPHQRAAVPVTAAQQPVPPGRKPERKPDRKPDREPEREPEREAERVLLLAGAAPGDLARQLGVDDRALLNRDDTRDCPQAGPCRLAIVAPTPRRLDLARRIVAQGKPWHGRNDVWFTATPLLGDHAPEPGLLAFVFPGLEQAFAPRVEDVADHFGLARPDVGGTHDPGQDSGQDPGHGLGQHGLGVVAVGRLLDAALRELGIAPDLVAGHSVGEWNAMIAAGYYPRGAVDAFVAAFDPDALQVPGVVFAALGCGAAQAAAAIDSLAGVVVSHDNCPHQSIVCGDHAAVAEVLDRLRRHGVGGQIMPFRSGFHSPMLAPYLGPIRESVDQLPLQKPVVPVWSATTVAPYPDIDGDVRDLVIRHLVEPVRFGPLIRRLAGEGVRAFVQVGSGSLTGFIDDTLHDRAHLAVSANTPKRSGLDQLRRVAAALWAEGLAPRFDRLPGAASPHPRSLEPAPGNPPPPGTVRLDLGAPLVRLGDSVAPLVTPARPEPPAASGHPVLAEFDAVLRDATAAVRDVVGSWERRASATRRRATTTRVLSVEAMPFLADHCLYRQPSGWADESDRYPVVPMTTTLELMMEAARGLVPGRTVVGIQGVRALRWLAVAPPVTVTISAALDEAANVKVVIDGYARGTVVLAEGYPPEPPGAGGRPDRLTDRPLAAERPCEVSADRLYSDRWMFHGPRFQGVAELGPIGEDGIRGVLATPSAPGALLDNAGQLMGFWIMASVSGDRLALPSAVDHVSFHGPHPRPGERVSCAVRIRSVTDAEVVADLELRTADGRLWSRVDGWHDRRFDTDELTWPVYRFPEERLVAEAQPGGWFVVRERWPDSATRELMMRRYLGATERAEYQRRNPRAQRQWLLGRVAVKDAVRQWLWDRGAGRIFPVEISVDHDEAGRPRVHGPFVEPLEVSLAHSGSLAVAVVSLAEPDAAPGGVGIDIEPVTERDGRFETAALTEAERALLDHLCADGDDDDAAGRRARWLTRFWTAKEAVAKAEGTGLGGRPKRFAVERVDGGRLLVSSDAAHAARWVETRLVPDLGPDAEPHAVAWTTPTDPPTPVGATARHTEHRGGHADGS